MDFQKDPDVQSMLPDSRFRITRVGVTGIKKPLHILRKDNKNILSTQIDVYVDLPSNQKGSHMSRNTEVVNEIVDNSVRHPYKGIEDACAEIGRRLLEKHDYASRAEVYMKADYYIERMTPEGVETLENYEITAYSYVTPRNVRKAIGAKVAGMTACPCAMESIKRLTGYDKKGEFITHNQRNITTLVLETGKDEEIEAEDIITVIEASLSSPTFELLKRKDEARVVLNAHKNPMFVEDVVRTIFKNLLQKFPRLDDDTIIKVKSESEESIHKHNAIAERVTTIGELKK